MFRGYSLAEVKNPNSLHLWCTYEGLYGKHWCINLNYNYPLYSMYSLLN